MARRLEPGWNFSTLYLIKDSLAIMLEAAGLLEDAFREYFELEACYLEALKQGGNLAGRQFGDFSLYARNSLLAAQTCIAGNHCGTSCLLQIPLGDCSCRLLCSCYSTRVKHAMML